MKTYKLRRFLVANNATLGELTGLSRTLYTLEDVWRNNARTISCIPAGTYLVHPHGWHGEPVRYKRVWQLQNVPGRSAILMHAGNVHQDTEGCILVGLNKDEKLGKILDSRLAIKLMRDEIGQQHFLLEIEDDCSQKTIVVA